MWGVVSLRASDSVGGFCVNLSALREPSNRVLLLKEAGKAVKVLRGVANAPAELFKDHILDLDAFSKLWNFVAERCEQCIAVLGSRELFLPE